MRSAPSLDQLGPLFGQDISGYFTDAKAPKCGVPLKKFAGLHVGWHASSSPPIEHLLPYNVRRLADRSEVEARERIRQVSRHDAAGPRVCGNGIASESRSPPTPAGRRTSD